MTEKRESESCEQFAERTQANLAKHLGIIATSVTLSDLLESRKPKQEGRQKKSISQSGTYEHWSCYYLRSRDALWRGDQWSLLVCEDGH